MGSLTRTMDPTKRDRNSSKGPRNKILGQEGVAVVEEVAEEIPRGGRHCRQLLQALAGTPHFSPWKSCSLLEDPGNTGARRTLSGEGYRLPSLVHGCAGQCCFHSSAAR